MSGAQRGGPQRRPQGAGARAVAQAKQDGPDKKVIAAIIGVILLAAAVIVGVVLTNNSAKDAQNGPIPTRNVTLAAGVVEQRDGAVVVSGKPEVQNTIDIYADFLCPACGALQAQSGEEIEKKVNAGLLKVRYHMVPLLVKASNPTGYSMDSANAALCFADTGKFTSFHDSLFATQPEEGGRAYSKDQLIQLGKDLGATDPNFATCVNAGTYTGQIQSDYDQLTQNPLFEGTPTILKDGVRVDHTDPNWLELVAPGNTA